MSTNVTYLHASNVGGRQSLSSRPLLTSYTWLAATTVYASALPAITSLKRANCSSSEPPGLQCAELKVPLDWSKLNGPQITLGMNRLEARDSQHRVGSLICNPGGPGGVASQTIAVVAAGHPYFTPGVSKHFDIIGLDPRGIGMSTPINCDSSIWNERVSYFPSDEACF